MPDEQTASERLAEHAADDPRKHIKMAADRVLARLDKDKGERRSRTGILIPATADVSRRLMWAEVVLVGPTVRNIEEGDRVLFSPEHSFEVDLRGDDYLLLRERDIHAVASDRNEGRTGLYL
jgi:chaperonin GroES